MLKVQRGMNSKYIFFKSWSGRTMQSYRILRILLRGWGMMRLTMKENGKSYIEDFVNLIKLVSELVLLGLEYHKVKETMASKIL